MKYFNFGLFGANFLFFLKKRKYREFTEIKFGPDPKI